MAEGTGRLIPQSWDIFCTVVDNYGDIGVCWRLARQLAHEYGIRVRLWVDDLGSLARIAPHGDFPGIEVRSWGDDFSQVEVADVVIEAFACELPHAYVLAMACRERKPVWINLEYLSAEEWVEDCHMRQSLHPSLPLVKHFFFPGFNSRTGGLIRESGLGKDFDAATFWQAFGLPPPDPQELRISMFGYGNPALEGLLEQWVDGRQPITCLVPQGALAIQASACVGAGRGSLRLHVFPFLPQPDYDRLLWACDCNFVRGEDSFVRAQWAARPFVWNIYPQDEGAHLPKIQAFLDRFCAGLNEEAASALRQFWMSWNLGTVPDWTNFWSFHESLARHARAWKSGLESQKDLAGNLVLFCKNKV